MLGLKLVKLKIIINIKLKINKLVKLIRLKIIINIRLKIIIIIR